MSALTLQRRLDDLVLHLKGLVHVRALLETYGASPEEIAAHSREITRVRAELAELARAHATELENPRGAGRLLRREQLRAGVDRARVRNGHAELVP
jgi:hypothetical protein